MQLIGKLFQVLPAQTGQGKNGEWRKQDIVVETDGQYPKKICISVWGDKLNNVKLQPGTLLTIDFDIESREYNGKWYTDIKAWRLSESNEPPVASSPNYNRSSMPPASAEPPSFDDDLPF